MRVAPAILPHQVGELGDRVAERAALRAERHAAVHAAAGLVALRVALEQPVRRLDLAPVAQALGDRALAAAAAAATR